MCILYFVFHFEFSLLWICLLRDWWKVNCLSLGAEVWAAQCWQNLFLFFLLQLILWQFQNWRQDIVFLFQVFLSSCLQCLFISILNLLLSIFFPFHLISLLSILNMVQVMFYPYYLTVACKHHLICSKIVNTSPAYSGLWE